MREVARVIGLFSLTLSFCSQAIPVFAEVQEYPSQVATDGSVTWELKSCSRKQNNVVSCILLLTKSEDGSYGIFSNNNTKLVDAEGNEYYPIKIQNLKKVVGSDALLQLNMAKDAQYKVTIDFGNVPPSVLYATLLQASANGTITGGGKFRNLPFVNLDGSIPTVPIRRKSSANQQPSSPTNSPTPTICLPIVGCIK